MYGNMLDTGRGLCYGPHVTLPLSWNEPAPAQAMHWHVDGPWVAPAARGWDAPPPHDARRGLGQPSRPSANPCKPSVNPPLTSSFMLVVNHSQTYAAHPGASCEPLANPLRASRGTPCALYGVRHRPLGLRPAPGRPKRRHMRWSHGQGPQPIAIRLANGWPKRQGDWLAMHFVNGWGYEFGHMCMRQVHEYAAQAYIWP